ncbi:hypothetical protein OS493_029835 [Desmophyllum pertusum]|uniref:Uncharacterized protein n=1 Tax=Desmophyllum pertusum TaxID=174260 RepID=A0A9W9YJY7_9CNID|nr:hypothetical protein OS493_029835 [Desmophyllum pertusum]
MVNPTCSFVMTSALATFLQLLRLFWRHVLQKMMQTSMCRTYMNFAASHAKNTGKLSTPASCDKTDGECSETDATEKYKLSSNEITDRNTAGNGKFRLTIYNPVANTGLRGVRIMQQIVPFRQSSVDIHFDSNLVVMTTENVARLCLKEPPVSPVMWHRRSVEIDGTAISAVKYKANQDCAISLSLKFLYGNPVRIQYSSPNSREALPIWDLPDGSPRVLF